MIIHCFKEDFKHYKLVKKEWLHMSEVEGSAVRYPLSFISFRTVEKMKMVNHFKTTLLNHYGLTPEDILSETFLEGEMDVTDGTFILTKMKMKKISPPTTMQMEKMIGSNNFFFLRDVGNLLYKHYFWGYSDDPDEEMENEVIEEY